MNIGREPERASVGRLCIRCHVTAAQKQTPERSGPYLT
jgi:hypothetical protein